MKRKYDNIFITFSMDNYEFCAQNIVFEQFQNPIPKHSHGENIYELHFIPYGIGDVKAGGLHFTASENTVFVTGPHIEHEQYPNPSNPMAEYCVFFRVTPEKGLNDRVFSPASVFYQTKLWYGQDTQNIGHLMSRLFVELDSEPVGYMEAAEAILRSIIISFIRNYRTAKLPQRTSLQKAPQSHTQLMLDESFLYDCGTLTLDMLADRLGLSPRQTQRLLKELYGQSFQQKKTASRMSLAFSLLTTTELSITEIALKLGYSSIEHFSSAFRKYAGISPLSYRDSARDI